MLGTTLDPKNINGDASLRQRMLKIGVTHQKLRRELGQILPFRLEGANPDDMWTSASRLTDAISV